MHYPSQISKRKYKFIISFTRVYDWAIHPRFDAAASAVCHILAYLPRLDIAAKPNGKSGRVSGNNTENFQVAM
jgi:hypothetical protein